MMEFARAYTKQGLNDVVVSFVKNKILAGEYKAGDKLLESEISTELDISRAPVREAMRQLNAEGMILFSPRKGNYVLDLEPEELLDVLDIRTVLESQVYGLLLKHNQLKEENFTYLYDNIHRMQQQEHHALAEHDMLYWLNSLDLQFHRHLWQAFRSGQRTKILEGLFYQLLIAMNRNTITLGTFQEKAQEHLRIVNALKNHDLELAVTEFSTHMNIYANALTDILV